MIKQSNIRNFSIIAHIDLVAAKVRLIPLPPGGESCIRSLAAPLPTARGAAGSPKLI